MDYLPEAIYMDPKFYWPDLDTAMREANFRGVQVHFLVAHWEHSKPAAVQYLVSLNDLDNIEVKYYVVPKMDGVENIPYTRVNHAKFVVTDQSILNYIDIYTNLFPPFFLATYVSNNNWTADYFFSTAGLSSVIQSSSFIQRLKAVFERDWNGPYTSPLSAY
jgi:phospholipase D3/4